MIGLKSGQNIFQSGKLGPFFHKNPLTCVVTFFFFSFFFQVKYVKIRPQKKTLQMVDT